MGGRRPGSVLGLALILEPWRLQGKTSDFLAIGGALFWAASAVYAKILRKKHEVDLLSLTAWQMLLGSLPLIIISMATWEYGAAVDRHLHLVFLAFVAVLGGNALAWVLWLYILNSFGRAPRVWARF